MRASQERGIEIGGRERRLGGGGGLVVHRIYIDGQRSCLLCGNIGLGLFIELSGLFWHACLSMPISLGLLRVAGLTNEWAGNQRERVAVGRGRERHTHRKQRCAGLRQRVGGAQSYKQDFVF